MSKLLAMYTNLKKQNSEILYLFKSGIFYLAIDKDAICLSKLLGLKLTSLNNNTLKCGFPCNSLDKYIKLLQTTNLNIKIIDTEKDTSYYLKEYKQEKLVTELLSFITQINIDNLSVLEAYKTIESLKQKATQIVNNLLL